MNQPTSIKRILVVDDDADIVVLLSMRLRAKGYEVVTAPDGQEALIRVQSHRPDLIIADLQMPNLDGWRLSQKVRDNPAYKNIPIILLSALVSRDGPPDDVEVGDYYMGKPYDIESLLNKIKELLHE